MTCAAPGKWTSKSRLFLKAGQLRSSRCTLLSRQRRSGSRVRALDLRKFQGDCVDDRLRLLSAQSMQKESATASAFYVQSIGIFRAARIVSHGSYFRRFYPHLGSQYPAQIASGHQFAIRNTKHRRAAVHPPGHKARDTESIRGNSPQTLELQCHP